MISESVHYLAVHYLMDKCFIVVPLCRAVRARFCRSPRLDSDSSIYTILLDIAVSSRTELFRGVYEYGCSRLNSLRWGERISNNYYSPIQFAMPININVVRSSQ